MERNFQFKSTDKLREQTLRVTSAIGASIIPTSGNDEVFSLSSDELRQHYPVRYDIYVSSLRRREATKPEIRKLQMLNTVDRYSLTHYNDDDKQVLKERQMNVFEDIRIALESGINEGTIQAPTGLGKTVIFNQFVVAADVSTLIVVPTRKLVEQTYLRFAQFSPQLQVGRVYGERKEYGSFRVERYKNH